MTDTFEPIFYRDREFNTYYREGDRLYKCFIATIFTNLHYLVLQGYEPVSNHFWIHRTESVDAEAFIAEMAALDAADHDGQFFECKLPTAKIFRERLYRDNIAD